MATTRRILWIMSILFMYTCTLNKCMCVKFKAYITNISHVIDINVMRTNVAAK